MRFQEGKFLFEKWKSVYAVLLSVRIRKNGIIGSVVMQFEINAGGDC
jgi:hypothetical protein